MFKTPVWGLQDCSQRPWQIEETDNTNGNKEPRTTSGEIEGELQGQTKSLSERTIRLCHWGGLRCWKKILKNKSRICQNAYWRATKLLGQSPLDRWDKTRAFWQITSALSTDAKLKCPKKRAPYRLWNVEEARIWSCLVSVTGHGFSTNTVKNTQDRLRTKHWTVLTWPSMI